jgi:hypothetical protein
MIKKEQTVHFENEQQQRTASVRLVLDPAMDIMPMFYRMIMLQETSTIFCGRQKWDAWKLCKTPNEQMNFLHKHVWTYEPGKMPPHLDERFQTIRMMAATT